MNKMDTRIRELESELDAESRRFADAQKNLRRSERRIKELTFASDEDRKNHERIRNVHSCKAYRRNTTLYIEFPFPMQVASLQWEHMGRSPVKLRAM